MIQNIQIVRLLPPEVSMEKNKMLKLDKSHLVNSHAGESESAENAYFFHSDHHLLSL